MINDGSHTYTYDAEGNITQVDGGSTATYSYDAFNQRVRIVQGSTATEYVFNLSGKRVSTWDGTSHAQLQGQYYWGSTPIAFYQGGSLHFQHQDWQGTERVLTSYNGSVEGTYSSLPWGDGYSTSGTDPDAYHFAQLDHDTGSNTEHAQFRQLSATQGRWLSPDPYNGSYDLNNPQSFNRYAYVMNSPLGSIDPSGLLYETVLCNSTPYYVDGVYEGTDTVCFTLDDGGVSDDPRRNGGIGEPILQPTLPAPPDPIPPNNPFLGKRCIANCGTPAPNNGSTPPPSNRDQRIAQCIAQVRSEAKRTHKIFDLAGGVTLENLVVACPYAGPLMFECEAGVAGVGLLTASVTFLAEQYQEHQDEAACIQKP